MAKKHLSDGNPEGTTLGQDASDLVGFHGIAIAQGATIATTASTLVSLRAKFNLLLAAIKAKGIIASS